MKELTIREKALLFLSDGRWHLFGEILHTPGKEIMPERATQIYYTAHHKHLGDRDSATKKSMDEKIQLGRSRIISKIVQDLKRGKIIEARGLHGKKQKMLVVGSEIKLKYSTPKELITYLNVFENMTWAIIKDEANREVVRVLIETIRQRLRAKVSAKQNRDIEVEVVMVLIETIRQRLRAKVIPAKQDKDIEVGNEIKQEMLKETVKP